MELNSYLKFFKRFWIFILFCAFLGLVIAISLAKAPSPYSLTQVFYLSSPKITASDPSQSFYNQEMVRNFTDTAVAILNSPDFKSRILQPQETFFARKLAPQVIRLTATSQEPQETQVSMKKVIEIFNQRFASPLSLEEIAPQAPTQRTFNGKVVALAGFIIGFAFAIFVISTKTYLRL